MCLKAKPRAWLLERADTPAMVVLCVGAGGAPSASVLGEVAVGAGELSFETKKI